MRRPALLLSILCAGCGSIAYTSPDEPLIEAESYGSEVAITLAIFYEELAPYGEWIDHPALGRVFVPYDPDYRPFRNGHWVESEDGLVWVSYDAIGWAVCHYGAWTVLDDERWAWVPGTEWSPAPVEWRRSETYVGWAPIMTGTQAPIDAAWAFVDVAFLLAQSLSELFVPSYRVHEVYATCAPFEGARPSSRWMRARGVRGMRARLPSARAIRVGPPSARGRPAVAATPGRRPTRVIRAEPGRRGPRGAATPGPGRDVGESGRPLLRASGPEPAELAVPARELRGPRPVPRVPPPRVAPEARTVPERVDMPSPRTRPVFRPDPVERPEPVRPILDDVRVDRTSPPPRSTFTPAPQVVRPPQPRLVRPEPVRPEPVRIQPPGRAPRPAEARADPPRVETRRVERPRVEAPRPQPRPAVPRRAPVIRMR